MGGLWPIHALHGSQLCTADILGVTGTLRDTALVVFATPTSGVLFFVCPPFSRIGATGIVHIHDFMARTSRGIELSVAGHLFNA